MRGELIVVNRIMRGIDIVDRQILYPRLAKTKTRGQNVRSLKEI